MSGVEKCHAFRSFEGTAPLNRSAFSARFNNIRLACRGKSNEASLRLGHLAANQNLRILAKQSPFDMLYLSENQLIIISCLYDFLLHGRIGIRQLSVEGETH